MKKEEEYIVNESAEISIGEAPGWTNKLLSAFPSLKYRNYQLYFTGQLISLIGTWLQAVAQGYLIYEITKSAFWVGLIAALQTLPVLIFALFGGVIVDRFKKRNIIYATQIGQMILAIMLGVLTLTGVVDKYQIAVLSFLLGIFTALDIPARQTFMNDLVDEKDLSSAVSLNAGVYNAARAIGPATAGILIGIVGTGGAFMLNGLSFVAVLIALRMMRVNEYVHDNHPHPIRAIKEGITYSFSHKVIGPLLILAAILSILGWSYLTIMPVIAKDIFHEGATGLGYLQAAGGLGAVIGAILVSAYASKIKGAVFIFGGAMLLGISLIAFSYATSLNSGMVTLFFTGAGLLMAYSMMNTLVQTLAEDKIRGRVVSIYTLMFVGMAPFGNLEIGYLSEKWGVMNALRVNAFLMVAVTLIYYFTQKKLRKI